MHRIHISELSDLFTMTPAYPDQILSVNSSSQRSAPFFFLQQFPASFVMNTAEEIHLYFIRKFRLFPSSGICFHVFRRILIQIKSYGIFVIKQFFLFALGITHADIVTTRRHRQQGRFIPGQQADLITQQFCHQTHDITDVYFIMQGIKRKCISDRFCTVHAILANICNHCQIFF